MTAARPPAAILRQITEPLCAATLGPAPGAADAAETTRPACWHVLIFPPRAGGPAFPPARPPRCVLPKAHTEQDTDHLDEHGHTAPVLVLQASIAEAARVSRARGAAQGLTAGA
jgi:hypothetical protein